MILNVEVSMPKTPRRFRSRCQIFSVRADADALRLARDGHEGQHFRSRRPKWAAPKAVDKHGHLVAAPVGKVVEDVGQELLGDPGGGLKLPRRTPGSPWIPMPISISPSGKSKVGWPAAGSTHDERATPMERKAVAAVTVLATTSAREAPSSARAPATLYSRAMPAFPADATRSLSGRRQRRRPREPWQSDPLRLSQLSGEIEVHDVALSSCHTGRAPRHRRGPPGSPPGSALS